MAVDRTRYNFNGKTNLTKKALIYEVVKYFLKENNTSLEDLKQIFSEKSDFNISMFVTEEEYQHFNEDRRRRYFDEPFEVNKNKIYLSNQWGGDVFQNLLAKIQNQLQYSIQETLKPEEKEFREKYKQFVATLPLQNSGNYAEFYTQTQQKPFKVNKNTSGSIVVRAFTEQASPMVISANQLSKVLFENGQYLYSSYEPVLIERILNENIVNQNEIRYEGEVESNSSQNTIKNITLYGVPGVGKTHNIAKLIRLIEDGKSDSDIFSSIQNNENSNEKLPDDLKERTAFVTFHQSFGYEDFIEGFRPNEDGKIELADGVFKRFANQARENLAQSQSTSTVPFKEALHRLLKEKIENGETVKIDLKRANSYYLIYDYNDRTIFFEKQNGDRTHSLSIRTLERMYRDERNDIIQGGLAPYYNPLLDTLLQIKHSGGQTTVERKNYYLVIDEINRGNISKIFGELITLIEEDKRDILEVTLPYSKEPFSVPSNLYIIGTMNSTDKSIALIDVALRRRFTFLKMEPSASLIEHDRARAIFEKLNTFLKERLGEDHLIGHSYFMKIQDEDDLNFVLDYKIKPLLEEYFYGDGEGLNETMKLLETP